MRNKLGVIGAIVLSFAIAGSAFAVTTAPTVKTTKSTASKTVKKAKVRKHRKHRRHRTVKKASTIKKSNDNHTDNDKKISQVKR